MIYNYPAVDRKMLRRFTIK